VLAVSQERERQLAVQAEASVAQTGAPNGRHETITLKAP
jgi:hypothetical protein